MATVAAVFTQEPRIRTPEEVVESLFYEGPRLHRETPKARAGPEFKRVWASLEKQKKELQVIKRYSDEYFRLARNLGKDAPRYLALEGTVTVVLRGQAYQLED